MMESEMQSLLSKTQKNINNLGDLESIASLGAFKSNLIHDCCKNHPKNGIQTKESSYICTSHIGQFFNFALLQCF